MAMGQMNVPLQRRLLPRRARERLCYVLLVAGYLSLELTSVHGESESAQIAILEMLPVAILLIQIWVLSSVIWWCFVFVAAIYSAVFFAAGIHSVVSDWKMLLCLLVSWAALLGARKTGSLAR
jgi:hypothetical protein